MAAYYNIHTHHSCKDADIQSIRSFSIDDTDISTDDFFSIGIHPWFIKEVDQQLAALKTYLNHPKLLAIGECGLDKLKGPDLKLQTEVFRAQVQISQEIKKPLIIHTVKTQHLILALHKQLKPSQAWIIHGFNGKAELAQQLTSAHIHISMGTNLLQNKERLAQIITFVSPNMLLFETDEDKPETIKSLYESTEKIKPGLASVVSQNAKIIFHF